MSYLRVVRFTGVTEDRIAGLKERLDERSGPPEGVTAEGVQFLRDEDQQTMVVIQRFASKEDMEQSEAALEAMDPSETPGTRQSVDRCEILAELNA